MESSISTYIFGSKFLRSPPPPRVRGRAKETRTRASPIYLNKFIYFQDIKTNVSTGRRVR